MQIDAVFLKGLNNLGDDVDDDVIFMKAVDLQMFHVTTPKEEVTLAYLALR